MFLQITKKDILITTDAILTKPCMIIGILRHLGGLIGATEMYFIFLRIGGYP